MDRDSFFLGLYNLLIQSKHPVFGSKVETLQADYVYFLCAKPPGGPCRINGTLPPPITITLLPRGTFSSN